MSGKSPSAMQCDFCAHRCMIGPGGVGRCGVRANRDGALVTLVYGRVVAEAVDPIEKKPLYHFLPGSQVYSIALAGCNFRCDFCQNYHIADRALAPQHPGRQLDPEQIVARWRASATPSIAFTYSEPTVWQDYLIECAQRVRNHGGKTVMVTNGFFGEAAVVRLAAAIDAFNIDLKGDDRFYRQLCGATDHPVRSAIGVLATTHHLEVTTMVIEGIHHPETIVALGQFLAASGVRYWHLSRFFPAHRMATRPATSEQFLAEVFDAVRGLVPYVYLGNSRQSHYSRTLCPQCATVCMERSAGAGVRVLLRGDRCPQCAHRVDGIFE